MEHKGTKTLETLRLKLRRAVPEDGRYMYENWAKDPDVTRFLTWPPHDSVETSRMILSSWIDSYNRPDYYQWMIELKETGQPIGSISVVSVREEINSCEIGYCIGSAWWHQGFMSEAAQAVVDFLFDEVGANRVEAKHDVDNPRSGAVMKKCGMQYEGTLRRWCRNNLGIRDVCVYALLAEDRRR